jgi:hypothetical protein
MANLDTDNVTALRPAKAKRVDNTAALRQRRSRAKRKRVTPVPATAIAQIAQQEKANEIKADVTVAGGDTRAVTAPSRRTNYALVAIAYGFFVLGIGINVWNATTGGTRKSVVHNPQPHRAVRYHCLKLAQLDRTRGVRLTWRRRRPRPARSGGRRGRTRTSATIIIELEQGHAR